MSDRGVDTCIAGPRRGLKLPYSLKALAVACALQALATQAAGAAPSDMETASSYRTPEPSLTPLSTATSLEPTAATAPLPAATPGDTAPDLPQSAPTTGTIQLPPQHGEAVEGHRVPTSITDRLLSGLEVQTWYQWFDQRAYTADGIENGHSDNTRVVLAYRRTLPLSDAFSFTFSDRLDLVQPITSFAAEVQENGSEQHTTNALRELFVDWRGPSSATPVFVDIGRVNLRNGVSSGYNPTDFFKVNAVVQTTTLDPNALREDRLGTVMARVQQIWDWGGVTLAFAPRLSSSIDPDRGVRREPLFGAALDRTNRFNALFAKVSPQVSQRLSIDVLAYLREQQNPRIGLNSALLIGDSVVADAELVVGRFDVLSGPDAPAIFGPPQWRPRASIGLTWTTSLGLSLTIENDYAGDALTTSRWRAWRQTYDTLALSRLNEVASLRSAEQEPLVQDSWFLRASADRLFRRPGLSASAFAFIDSFDGSVLWQGSISQAVTRNLQATLQVGGFDGNIRSEYGASTLKRYISAYLSYRL